MEKFTSWCIIILLIIAIIYALILNFRLIAFKNSKKEIQKTIHSFNQTVQNAETTLNQLQKRTQNITEQLKAEINKASQLRDDLVLILDKTTHTHISQTFKQSAPITYAKTNDDLSSKDENIASFNLYQSDAEKELSNALKKIKEES